MYGKTFEIETSDTHTTWAELQEGRVIIHRTTHSPSEVAPPQSGEVDEVVVQWDLDVLRNLLTWAAQEGAVVTTFVGPLSHQIREHSSELSMTPEMFVWHAVKVFIEVGTSP